MEDEQLDRVSSFRAFIKSAEQGAEIPEVNEADLKCLHAVCVDQSRRYSGKDGVVGIEVMARACSPGANLPAVWLRHTELRLLVRQGLLEDWRHGTALDDAVFHLAATIPMSDMHFDREAFTGLLRGRK
jgi:hypothetical protein